MADYQAVLPERSRASELWTWADAVDSVLDYFDRPKSGRDERLALRAVEDAYREFPTRHDWKFLHRRLFINTSATYNTGTVAFDLTGGTYERMLTLTSGTWPTDAAYGNIEIDMNVYEVADYKTTTVVTLRADASPTADIASGETYRWYRDTYPLPPDFLRIGDVFEPSRGEEYPLRSVERDFIERNNRAGGSYYTNNAEWFCVCSDKRYSDPVIMFSPIPSDATQYEASYQARCRPLTTYEYSTGTVTTSVGSAAVTGSGTAWTSAMEGAVIRISSTKEKPTSRYGNIDGKMNTPAMTRIVKAVASATSLTLDAVADTAVTSMAHTISDPLDFHVPTVGNAFDAMARYHFMIRSPGMEADVVDKQLQQAERLLLLAQDADRRYLSQQAGWYYDGWVWYFTGW